jgi:hypothetical protein
MKKSSSPCHLVTLSSCQAVRAIAICTVLCVLFAAISWTAVRGKSATWDEPSHAATGWLMLWRHDYRLSPDVPPLWEYWIALPTGPDSLHFDAHSSNYLNLRTKMDLFRWCVSTLYQTPGNDGVALVNRGRMMALALGVALAILIGRWAWRLGGTVAAVSAMFLYCFDPNFLGHAPLVKNDVPFALAFFAACYATWRLGQAITWRTAVSVVLLTAVAVGIKLSGVLLAPIMITLLTIRAVSSRPWPVFGRPMQHRSSKFAAAFVIWFACLIVTYAGLWAAYGFRYDAGPNGLQAPVSHYVDMLGGLEIRDLTHRPPTTQEMRTWTPPLSTKVIVFLDSHHLLPQAWSAGFVLTQFGDHDRVGYLCGGFYTGGKWYYFPAAAIFKSPLATTLACLIALGIARDTIRKGLLKDAANRWAAISLFIPVLVYAAALLNLNMNLGLRYAFPIYPFVFVAVGLAAKRLWEAGSPRPDQATSGRILVLILASALVAETVAAFPNYIAFFNAICARDRASLLGDSNLDWGQDLPLLAQWQQQHPDELLYLDYFGLCDPHAYGIRYINVGNGYIFGPPKVIPIKAGVVAISATQLQQIYYRDPVSIFFEEDRPLAILGDSIYLFNFDPSLLKPTATHPN